MFLLTSKVHNENTHLGQIFQHQSKMNQSEEASHLTWCLIVTVLGVLGY